MKIIFKIHFLFFISAFICFVTGLFKDFIIISSIVLVHEAGHIISGLCYKWKIEKVILLPVGGITIFNQKINSNLKEEFVIAISGFVFQTIYYLLTGKNNYLFKQYYFFILFFNMLPIHPLDGSKIINVLFNLFLPFKKSYIINIILSIIITVIIILLNINNLIIVLSLIILIPKIYKYYQIKNITFNKFLLERYIYNFNFKKTKIIKNINNMYKQKKHILNIENKLYKESEILSKRFDSKGEM